MKHLVTQSTIAALVVLGSQLASLTSSAQEQQPGKPSILDRVLLDPAIRRAGLGDDADAAERAKRLGKDWLNPFAPEADISADLDALRRMATGQEEELEQIAQSETFTPKEKRTRVVKLLGKARACPTCGARGPLDWAYCPYDGHRMAIANESKSTHDVGRVAIAYGGSASSWSGAFASRRLAATGFDVNVDLDIIGARASSDEINKIVEGSVGILHRGSKRGISPTFIRWIEEGRRGLIFIRTEFLDEDEVNWMRDKLGIIVVPSKGKRLLDGGAVAWFCEGLDVEMGQGYKGYGTRQFHCALKCTDDWEKKYSVGGEIFSAYRRFGKGELIVSALGEEINHASLVTIFDDSLIQLADNELVVKKVIRWLAAGQVD